MERILKYRFEILTFLAIAVVFFILRLPNLTLQPIFADEAIYVRWAQVMRAEPTLRFLPLSDGKTPLFMWAMIPLFKIFHDPLYAGRFLSVISGFLTMMGVLFLGWRFFNKRTGFIAAFLIAVTPFIVFFDRMALVDSMLAAFSIWSLNLGLLLIKYPRLDIAMFLGFLLGGGLLTKPPGFFNVVVLPITILIFNWKEKIRQSKLLKIFSLWVLAIIITVIIYNILRLGPGFVNLNTRNQDYVFSPQDILKRPWDPLWPHLFDLRGFFLSLLGFPLMLLIAVSIIFMFQKRNRIAIAVFFWAVIPLFIQTSLLKTFTARYILSSIPPLLTLAAFGLDQILKFNFFKKKYLQIAVLLIILIWPMFFIFNLLLNPANTPLYKNEKKGYFEDWTAGYGFPEIADYLTEKSKKDFLVVGTEGFFGTLPDGLQIYLNKNRQIVLVGSRATVSAQLRQAAIDHPTYFVANKSRYYLYQEGLELIKEYKKPVGPDGSQDAILFFKVKPNYEATSSSVKK